MTHSHGMEFSSANSHHAMESLSAHRPVEFNAALYPERMHNNLFQTPQTEGLAGILPPLRIVENYPHNMQHTRTDQSFHRHHLLPPLSPPLYPFSPLLSLNFNLPQNYGTTGGDCSAGAICPSPLPALDQPGLNQMPQPGDQALPPVNAQQFDGSMPPVNTQQLDQPAPAEVPQQLDQAPVISPIQQLDQPAPMPTSQPADNPTTVPVAKVPDSQLTMTGAPTITPEKINQVLKEYHSPAAGMGQYIYDQGVKHGINPAMALAFYVVESSCGTKGLAVQNKSWGNVRGHGPHGYRPYDSIKESLDQWYNLIDNLYLNKFHADKIGKVVSHYAPNSDGNHESVYVHALASLVRKWDTV